MKRIASALTAATLLLAFLPAGAHAGDKGHEGEPTTIRGCLADGEADGWYVLTVKKDDGSKQVTVAGDESFEGHIGHEVELTGTWVKDEEGDKHFAATAMQHIAATCS
jgi:hypothetical protein